MLKRLYANNFRCLVNFEINFDPLTLLIGPNGGGKSTIFDLLFGLRRLIIENAKVSDVFPPEDRTAWVDQTEQSVELDVQGQDGLFAYKLIISHNPDLKKQRVEHEALLLDGKPLFEFKRGEVQLYHDDHQPGPAYSFDWSVSALATIVPRPDNTKLTAFKAWVERAFIVSLQPKAMSSETAAESGWLNRGGANFASWYRFIIQEYQDKTFELTQQLRDTIPGFHAFKLEQAGKHRILKVGFGNENNTPVFFDFERISDGQRVRSFSTPSCLGCGTWDTPSSSMSRKITLLWPKFNLGSWRSAMLAAKDSPRQCSLAITPNSSTTSARNAASGWSATRSDQHG